MTRPSTFWNGSLVRDALAAVLYVVVFAFVLGANPFRNETTGPFDLLVSGPAWRTAVEQAPEVINRQRPDVLDTWLPKWLWAKQELREGRLPLWFPFSSGGHPGFQLLTSAMLTVPFAVFAVVSDGAFGYYLSCLLRLLLAGFGIYLFLRKVLARTAAFWGGLVFALCGFNSAWFYWPQTTTSLCIPWLLWATLGFLRSRHPWWLAGIAGASALMVLGGFPFTTLCGFWAFGILVVVWLSSDIMRTGSSGLVGRAKSSAWAFLVTAGAAALGAAACSFALLPLRELLSMVNLSYRGETDTLLRLKDLGLLVSFGSDPDLERTCFVGLPAVLVSVPAAVTVFLRRRTGIGRTAWVRLSRSGSGDDSARWVAAFALVLTLAAVLVSFGMLPRSLVRLMPGMANNPWHRSVVLVGLGVALLSGTGLDVLLRVSRRLIRVIPWHFGRAMVRPAACGLLAVLFLAQFSSQLALFRRFNAVVPASWFFPSTPTTDYLRDNLQPFQSVVAGEAVFQTCGVLTAYGIPEWFARDFRRDEEKQVLSRVVSGPFGSATAAIITTGAFNTNSAYADALGIRYLVMPKDSLNTARVVHNYRLAGDAPPPLPDYEWAQFIQVPRSMRVTAFSCPVQANVGDFPLHLLELVVVSAADGKTLLRAHGTRTKHTESGWVDFSFGDGIVLPPGPYVFCLSAHVARGIGVSSWATPSPAHSDNYLAIDGTPSIYSLRFLLTGKQEHVSPDWRVVDTSASLAVLENRRVTGSAYLVGALAMPPDSVRYGNLDVDVERPDRIVVNYSGATSGWVVLPMRAYPGWRARVNGVEVTTGKYLDVLPAIPVSGPAEIAYEYDPASLKRGTAISLAAILVAVAGVAVLVVRRRRAGRGLPRSGQRL